LHSNRVIAKNVDNTYTGTALAASIFNNETTKGTKTITKASNIKLLRNSII